MNVRMFPPNYSPAAQIVCGTRSYSGTPGQFVDVPSTDVGQLIGWATIAPSGPSSARPSYAPAGTWFVDTTLGYAIVSDGALWRNPITSAAV